MKFENIKKDIVNFLSVGLFLILLTTIKSNLKADDLKSTQEFLTDKKEDDILKCIVKKPNLIHYMIYDNGYIEGMKDGEKKISFKGEDNDIFNEFEICGLKVSKKSKSNYTKEFLSYIDNIYNIEFSKSISIPFPNPDYGIRENSKFVHQFAIDLFGKIDLKVKPVIEGVVIYSSKNELKPFSSYCGQSVIIYNPANRFISINCHLKEKSIIVENLDIIRKNYHIGKIGKTGINAEKLPDYLSHLHLSIGKVYDNGNIISITRKEIKTILTNIEENNKDIIVKK